MEKGIKNLKQKAADLESGNTDDFPSYHKAKLEILAKNEYQGKPLLAAQHTAHPTRHVSSEQSEEPPTFDQTATKVEKEGAKFVKAMAECIEQRYSKNKPPVFDELKEVFSRETIMHRPDGYIPPQLKSHAELAKAAGYLREDVTQEELNEQYIYFIDRMTNEAPQHDKENGWYHSVLHDEEVKNHAADVAHLAAAAIARTSSEAVVEGMGSVAKKPKENRGMLNHETFKQELSIHWNGPPTGTQCNKLLANALDNHFKGKEWHFFRRSDRQDKLKSFHVSKTVDKFNKTDGRLKW